MNATIGELVNWILLNRRGKAFRDYTPERITSEIMHSIEKNGFEYSTNIAGQFNGVVCGEVIDGEFMVYDVLTTENGVMKKLMQTYINRFRSIRIIGHVRDRERHFNNPQKLMERLS